MPARTRGRRERTAAGPCAWSTSRAASYAPTTRSQSRGAARRKKAGLFAAHAIADRANRLDELAGVAELGAQALDVGLDGARRRVDRVAPDVAQQLLARAHPALPFHEVHEQAELEQRERHLLP